MLIDKSYFEGDLKIPYNEITQERLEFFIQKYEEELLRDLLGYDLFKQFMSGLEDSAVDPKWNDLLLGAEYTWYGKLKKWDGLIHTMGATSIEIIRTEPFDIVVGRGDEFDPLPNSDTVVIPPAFVPFRFTFWQRAYGKLRSDEFDILVADDGIKSLKLLKWKFEDEDTYTYVAPNSLSISSASLTYRSLIANYVYWHWLADSKSQVTTLGNTKSKAENAAGSDEREKMIRAWNEMARDICSMSEFLTVNEAVYTGWDSEQAEHVRKTYWRTNLFDL